MLRDSWILVVEVLFDPSIASSSLSKKLIVLNNNIRVESYLADFNAWWKQDSASLNAQEIFESFGDKLLLYKMLINIPLMYICRQVPWCIKIFSAVKLIINQWWGFEMYLLVETVLALQD